MMLNIHEQNGSKGREVYLGSPKSQLKRSLLFQFFFFWIPHRKSPVRQERYSCELQNSSIDGGRMTVWVYLRKQVEASHWRHVYWSIWFCWHFFFFFNSEWCNRDFLIPHILQSWERKLSVFKGSNVFVYIQNL